MNSAVEVKSNVKQAVPFFGITNMDTSLKFYIEGLGFNMKLKWMDEGKLRWCWLELGEAAIMLQEYKPEFLPKEKVGVGVTICFTCEDAIALYREFISRGVNASRPFVGNWMWVTSCADPDGYRLEFESKTDVPEGSVLPE